MFTDIKEGLEIYKEEVRKYLKGHNEIDKKVKKEKGEDCSNSIYWNKTDFAWKTNSENMLKGMALALGLSKEEKDKIWQEIKEELKL